MTTLDDLADEDSELDDEDVSSLADYPHTDELVDPEEVPVRPS